MVEQIYVYDGRSSNEAYARARPLHAADLITAIILRKPSFGYVPLFLRGGAMSLKKEEVSPARIRSRVLRCCELLLVDSL